jgi:hypothetical protein
MSKISKRWRDAVAKSLWEARSLLKDSYRDLSTSDLYKSFAHAEERRKGELEETHLTSRPSLKARPEELFSEAAYAFAVSQDG